ncbi:aminopeptidase N [Allokutzneria sp. A3M-2-11 16]|uniref:aminopeptidase N n=1 Tax=Allokutzneria sp. A3M-2-11 16 TaxID=2962043 RepID=UPI0020B8F261|nr:aminopeptidase N [Allokutzneria sp. A3M-2-11 16]MCP3803130.1 aminopeptidase N [Allokutzneria sp. A3M-2-11 16]
MVSTNLTEVAARERARLVEVDEYRIRLDLTGDHTFASTTEVWFRATRPGSTVRVDLVADTVHEIVLNGQSQDDLLLQDLQEHNHLVVRADCQYLRTGAGLHRFVDPVDDGVYLFTQFEPADAQRVFACFDQPDLKARFELTVVAPPSWTLVSNTPVLERRLLGDFVEVTFEQTPPLPTYLVSLVAGPYAEFRDDSGSVPLGLYCRSSLAKHLDASRLFTETKQGLEFLTRSFGTQYPFAKYDQCFVPEFNGGAMENAACTTLSEKYVFRGRVTRTDYERRAETLLHELAHMWFGDLVTMRWWDDLWLNESFATWVGFHTLVEATEYRSAWATFAVHEEAWARWQDKLPSAHPIACPTPDLYAAEVNFDGITYAKGASVLRQLVARIGLDTFLVGLREYFRAHAWDNATLADLIIALSKAADVDLSSWTTEWLTTIGVSVLRPDFTVEDGKYTRFAVCQESAPRTHRLAVGVYSGASRRRVELEISGPRTEVPSLVGVPAGDLVVLNDDALTYADIRLDAGSLAAVREGLSSIDRPLTRALCWSATWEMVRDAELRARDLVDLVMRHVGAETEVSVVARVLWQAGTSLSYFADPAWEAQGWQIVSDRLVELALSAEPGSDHQLAFVRSLAGSVLSPSHSEVLRGWFSGSLPGLSLDTDLRWHILCGLVAHGAADASEIAAELKRDPTATGHLAAEKASALLPTMQAKEKAWLRLIQGNLSNATSEAIVGGFWHPAQPHLLRPYVARYFDDVDGVWARRSSESAQTVVRGLFPEWHVNEETIDLASRWLSADRPAGLRRIVSEANASVVRALAARRCDRG